MKVVALAIILCLWMVRWDALAQMCDTINDGTKVGQIQRLEKNVLSINTGISIFLMIIYPKGLFFQ